MKKKLTDDYWLLATMLVVLMLLFQMSIWVGLTMLEETVGLPPGWTTLNQISDLLPQLLIVFVTILYTTRDKP